MPNDVHLILEQMVDEYKVRCERAGRVFSADDSDVVAEDDDGVLTIRMTGPMDGGILGISASDVIAKLDAAKELDREVHLIINSPGGLVGEGLALYTEIRALVDKGVKVRTEGRGIVASAAVLPLLAGNQRIVADGTMVMIHNPHLVAMMIGDADTIMSGAERAVSTLRAHQGNYTEIVARHTGMEQVLVEDAMAKETWYTASEAKEAGYESDGSDSGIKAYHLSESERAAARVLSKFKEI